MTLEADVKATLTKVQLGEVDAGLVYVTDVKAAGDKVIGVRIPHDVNLATMYPIAAAERLRERRAREGIRAVRAVRAGEGRAHRGGLRSAVKPAP